VKVRFFGKGDPWCRWTACALGCAVWLTALPVLAQVVHQPAGPNTARVDTVVAVLEISPPDSLTSDVTFHVVQDTILFGELLHLVVDHAGVLPAFALADGSDWLVPRPHPDPGFWGRLFGRGAAPAPAEFDLPPPDDLRSVLSFTVYAAQPFRVRFADHLSPVVQVRNRIAGTEDTAAIRAPRPVGLSPLLILVLLAALAVVVLVAWVFWARGPGREPLVDREIPPPAWLGAATELRALFWEGALARGDTRPYLDRLAGIVRRFVAGRYRVSAQDMTGREIIRACAALGHQTVDPGAIGRLIDDMDHRRYDPASATPAWCREQTVKFFEMVGRVRVMPRYTEVPPETILEAEQAWTALKREFAGATGRGRISQGAAGERGA
jgi:hypothetical protein